MRSVHYAILILVCCSTVCVTGNNGECVSKPFDYELIISCDTIEQCAAIDTICFNSVNIVPTGSLVCDNGLQSIVDKFLENDNGLEASGTAVEGGSKPTSPTEGQKKNAGVLIAVSWVMSTAIVAVMAFSI
ncbi:hypothetical protein BZA77DRAFT_290704 [Pyronema omphalodes]|nr:hypothetical protein BZA77DRAFT_290704 [Pyronema omphalodes]